MGQQLCTCSSKPVCACGVSGGSDSKDHTPAPPSLSRSEEIFDERAFTVGIKVDRLTKEDAELVGDVESIVKSPRNQAGVVAGSMTDVPENKEPCKASAVDDLDNLEDVSAVLRSVARLVQAKEWVEAEFLLSRALKFRAEADRASFWKQVADDDNVKHVLHYSKILWDAKSRLPLAQVERPSVSDKAAALGYPGWSLISPVSVDFKQLFPDVDPVTYLKGLQPLAQVLWRQEPGLMQIRILAQVPLPHPKLPTNWCAGFLSMITEAELLMNMVPVLVEPPSYLRPPLRDFTTWKEKTRIRFIASEVHVWEQDRLFTPEGLVVLQSRKVFDASDERVSQLEVPSGYTRSPGREVQTHTIVIGEEEMGVTVSIDVPMPNGKQVPSFILNFFLGWLVPTIVRKTFFTAAQMFTDPDYVQRQEADKTGLYARIAKAVAEARQCAKDRGYEFSMFDSRRRPSASSFQSGSLWELTREL
eukprot:TRINITY_DN38176_c0_g1_i1.p1 TRINITY_DN38176_c0_g1~~TRINITY_DN38176_c0_g1_i1.p1  ORF type:complete len:474 (+),score=50.24 TRINITY_DN38176_c0_g1_i1:77-1498(+)